MEVVLTVPMAAAHGATVWAVGVAQLSRRRTNFSALRALQLCAKYAGQNIPAPASERPPRMPGSKRSPHCAADWDKLSSHGCSAHTNHWSRCCQCSTLWRRICEIAESVAAFQWNNSRQHGWKFRDATKCFGVEPQGELARLSILYFRAESHRVPNTRALRLPPLKGIGNPAWHLEVHAEPLTEFYRASRERKARWVALIVKTASR